MKGRKKLKRRKKFLCKNDHNNGTRNYIRTKMPKKQMLPYNHPHFKPKNYGKLCSPLAAILANSLSLSAYNSFVDNSYFSANPTCFESEYGRNC